MKLPSCSFPGRRKEGNKWGGKGKSPALPFPILLRKGKKKETKKTLKGREQRIAVKACIFAKKEKRREGERTILKKGGEEKKKRPS